MPTGEVGSVSHSGSRRSHTHCTQAVRSLGSAQLGQCAEWIALPRSTWASLS